MSVSKYQVIQEVRELVPLAARQLQMMLEDPRTPPALRKQLIPVVKPELGNLDRISFVRFHLMDRHSILIPVEQDRIHSGDKDPRAVQEHSDRFIVPAGMFHDHLGFPVQAVQLIDQSAQSFWGVGNLKRLQGHGCLGLENRNRAPAV